MYRIFYRILCTIDKIIDRVSTIDSVGYFIKKYQNLCKIRYVSIFLSNTIDCAHTIDKYIEKYRKLLYRKIDRYWIDRF